MNELKTIKYQVNGEISFYHGSVKGLYHLEPTAKLISVTELNLINYSKTKDHA